MARHRLGAIDSEHEEFADLERHHAQQEFQKSAAHSARGQCNRALETLAKGYGHIGSAVAHDTSKTIPRTFGSIVGEMGRIAKDAFREFCVPTRGGLVKKKATRKRRRRTTRSRREFAWY
jgi:hypothetical protein